MKNKLICTLIFAGLIASPIKANAAVNIPTSTPLNIESEQIAPMTAYDWWVYNLGVSGWGISQIKGPLSGGNFNTEGVFGGNRTFTISWSGASSGANFKIKAVGQDAGNSGSSNSSATCTGSSGSVKLTIPYNDRGIIKLYVDSYSASAINISSIHVDSM